MTDIISDAGLKGMSLSAAFRLAVAESRRTDDDIAAAMGWGPSVAGRFFSNNDYWPSLPSIPRFCRVVGNTVIPRWIMANMDYNQSQPQTEPVDAAAMVMLMAEFFGDVGSVAMAGRDAVADGEVDPVEARRVLRRLRELYQAMAPMLAALQAVLDASKGTGSARGDRGESRP